METIWKEKEDRLKYQKGEFLAELIWKDSYITEDSVLASQLREKLGVGFVLIFTRLIFKPDWLARHSDINLPSKQWFKMSLEDMVSYMIE